MCNSDPKPDAHTRFILGVHADSPGLTERSIGAARTQEGLSSYQAFCDFAEPGAGQAVMDLACGNGPLSEIVVQRIGSTGSLVGVDPSGPELALAARRLHRFPKVRLLQESADRLSVPDASVDVVLCHMAFMLFAPLGPAVDEIARVVKPGGAFAAVIPTLRPPSDLFRECAGVLKAALEDERHDRAALSGNTVPMQSVDDLRRIFGGDGWMGPSLRTRALDVALTAPPEALVGAVTPAFYNYRLLSAAARRRVDAKWTELFRANRDASGLTSFHFPLSAFLIRRA